MNYKTRMLEEILDLQMKIFKLDNYLKDKTSDPNSPSLEERQLNIMRDYFGILYERMITILRNDLSIESDKMSRTEKK